jgi:hypothetical protein
MLRIPRAPDRAMCSSPAASFSCIRFSRHQTTHRVETFVRFHTKTKINIGCRNRLLHPVFSRHLIIGRDRESGPLSDQNENKNCARFRVSHFGELSVSTAAEMNFIFFAPCLRSVLMAHHDLTAGAEIVSINCAPESDVRSLTALRRDMDDAQCCHP